MTRVYPCPPILGDQTAFDLIKEAYEKGDLEEMSHIIQAFAVKFDISTPELNKALVEDRKSVV